jgi:hypothetical protein
VIVRGHRKFVENPIKIDKSAFRARRKNGRANCQSVQIGLEKTSVLLKKPAGRLNAGFSGQTGFFTETVHFWGSQRNCKVMQHTLKLLESQISRV